MRIKEVLKEQGLSVQELADALGVSRQALSRQMGGRLLVETAERIADAIGVPVWHLFIDPKQMIKGESAAEAPGQAMIICPHCGKPVTLRADPAQG